MTQHLLLFTIGPVQPFIAQARKTRDLYAGSRLLSSLIDKAIDFVHNNGGTIIFPNVKGESKPNRFIAWVNQPENKLQQFGQDLEGAVRAEWFWISHKKDILDGVSKPDGYDEQIQAHLDIFWVIEPNVTNYKTAFETIENNLGAVKNIRSFGQFNYEHEFANGGLNHFTGERGRKCGLDGQRNVKFYRGTDATKTDVEAKQKILFTRNGFAHFVKYNDKRVPLSVLQPGEGLSAVSFVKRRYKPKGLKKDDFESTAEIALLDALSFLESKHKQKLESYKNLFDFEGDVFNAQLFFEENLTAKYLEKQGIELIQIDKLKLKSKEVLLQNAKERRDELEKELAKSAGFNFSKYYAILTFDGDSMGKWLGGELLKPNQDLALFHTEFAKCLSDFAIQAHAILDNGKGKTVYAGGDDFLGFVNLNHLFSVLKELRSVFRQTVDVPLAFFKDKEISFSVGICMAHYKTPLGLVVQKAREMLDGKAKNYEDKNAFAIAVMKGSGENHETVWQFGQNEENIDKLNYFIERLQKEIFSSSFIRTLRREFEQLSDTEHDTMNPNLEKAAKTELNRLILRGCQIKGDALKKESESKKLANNLWDLFQSYPKLNNFLATLHIAEFIERNLNDVLTQQKNDLAHVANS
jgi:CRISPR-associated protein Cmr2